MNDYDFMKLALKEAKKSFDADEVPVGAVIVQNGKVIAKGHNMKEHKNSCIYHAEIVTIKIACGKLNNWRLNNTTLYVTLEPCPMCASAIKQSRINKVVYLLDNKNKQIQNIVDSILKIEDANKPVEKIKLDISKFNSDDIEMLSSFFEKKRN